MKRSYGEGDVRGGRDWPIPRTQVRRLLRLSTRIPAHRASLALVDQAVVSGTNFATSIIIARFCDKAQLGLYLLAWSTIFIFNEVLSAVITTPYVVMSPTLQSERQAGYRGSALLHQVLLSLVAVLVLSPVGLWLRFGKRSELGALLEVVSGLLIILLFREFSRRMWFAHLEMRAAVLADTGASLLQMLLLGTIIAAKHLNAATAYAAIATAAAVPSTAWLLMYRKRLRLSAPTALRDFRMNWGLAKWIACSGAFWAAAMYSYPWLLVWIRGASVAGIWAACYGLVALSNPVLLGFGNYLGPKIAHIQGDDGVWAMRRYVYRSSLHFVSLLLPFALLVWFFGNFFIQHLYGPGFVGHEVVVRILAANVLLLGAVFSITRGFFVLQRADLDTYVNILAIASLFLLGLPMVRWYGVVGAAIGLTATAALTGVVRAVIFVRVTHRYSKQPIGYSRITTQEIV